MAKPHTQGLRISELARRAGVSTATVKHYLRQGLLPRPHKTGRTMAYYDVSCVRRIRRIKALQRERFLPLDIIKRMIDTEAGNEDEIEIGHILAKSDQVALASGPVAEAEVEARTGYPRRRIRELERRGLVSPGRGHGGGQYDALDLRIIGIAKRREELGLSFENAVEGMSIFREAVWRAVEEDTRRFVLKIMDEMPTRQALNLIREADEDLDRFMVLTRQKALRHVGQSTIRQFNLLADWSSFLMSPLSTKRHPPASPPARQPRLYDFLSGNFQAVWERSGPVGPDPDPAAASAALILMDRPAEAQALIDQYLPRPGRRLWDNTAAALACFFSASRAAGFSEPASAAKRAVGYLNASRSAARGRGLPALAYRYVCGAVYALLPEVFGLRTRGLVMLSDLEGWLSSHDVLPARLPQWAGEVMQYDLLPAIRTRVGVLLSQAGKPFDPAWIEDFFED